jgi:uncharacterized protein YndB with AHSA1/START domain
MIRAEHTVDIGRPVEEASQRRASRRKTMVDVTVSTTINRPVDQVFGFIANMENEPQWHTDALEVKRLSEGEAGKGTTYHVHFRPSSMGPSEGTVEVVEFEPGRRIVGRSDLGKMQPTLTHVFEAANDGTRVSRRIQIETSGVMMLLMKPMMTMMVRRRNIEFLANLKRVLET